MYGDVWTWAGNYRNTEKNIGIDPVRIQTVRLHGAGHVDALPPGEGWTLIHFEPSGGFIYDEMLPSEAWHCADPGGHEGCVARLRVADGGGPIGPNPVFGTGIIHVCTENYLQREGPLHCGARSLEEEPGGAFSWQGDTWARLIVGSHDFKYVNSNSPPTGSA